MVGNEWAKSNLIFKIMVLSKNALVKYCVLMKCRVLKFNFWNCCFLIAKVFIEISTRKDCYRGFTVLRNMILSYLFTHFCRWCYLHPIHYIFHVTTILLTFHNFLLKKDERLMIFNFSKVQVAFRIFAF